MEYPVTVISNIVCIRTWVCFMLSVCQSVYTLTNTDGNTRLYRSFKIGNFVQFCEVSLTGSLLASVPVYSTCYVLRWLEITKHHFNHVPFHTLEPFTLHLVKDSEEKWREYWNKIHFLKKSWENAWFCVHSFLQHLSATYFSWFTPAGGF